MDNDLLRRNRVILCHFDSYSAALSFARYGSTVLAPSPLPDGMIPVSRAAATGARYEPSAALNALSTLYGLDAPQLSPVDGFEEWMSDGEQTIRIHLARFTTFEPPREVMEPHGGVFKPISEMRGAAMLELNLLRRAFNLIMG